MTHEQTARLALGLLRESPEYLTDARQGAPVGNSVVGSLLSTLHGVPRQYAERAVAEAIAQLDREAETAPAEDGETFTVKRTGKPPLRFTGELAAEADSHEHDGPLQNRWHELRLYRTAGRQLVWAVAYRTRWQGEHDHHSADVTSEQGVVSELTVEFNPLAGYAGYPAGAHYEEKDRRQREAITLGYQRACSDLFRQAEIAEEVE